ncbi:MAG: hypothetical protein HQL19_07155 [Candidatus Omnitrophica bacterium]|nr:hypothetical protein [Candidatus Omnitrophota bacterium]
MPRFFVLLSLSISFLFFNIQTKAVAEKAPGPVQIFVSGERYDSLRDYRMAVMLNKEGEKELPVLVNAQKPFPKIVIERGPVEATKTILLNKDGSQTVEHGREDVQAVDKTIYVAPVAVDAVMKEEPHSLGMVAGVTPSMDQVVDDFKKHDVPMVDANMYASGPKDRGPLLLIADDYKVRILGLKEAAGK